MTNQQVTVYPNLSAWTNEGEELAYTAAHLPFRIGEWYDDGVRQFGAPAVIQAIAANRAALDTSGKPEYPYLARVKLHTIQNYARVTRAIRANNYLADYDFWHVDAVLGIPDIGKRLELLEAGKREGMGAYRFRCYRDEELGKLDPPPPDSVARLNGKVAELSEANHELNDAVQSYAAQALEYAAIQAAAAERLADEPNVGMTYQRGGGDEWATGRCPECGRALVCPKCGEVQS